MDVVTGMQIFMVFFLIMAERTWALCALVPKARRILFKRRATSRKPLFSAVLFLYSRKLVRRFLREADMIPMVVLAWTFAGLVTMQISEPNTPSGGTDGPMGRLVFGGLAFFIAITTTAVNFCMEHIDLEVSKR